MLERNVYEAFDKFLANSTWHTKHPADEIRFFEALADVVWNKGFNADEMAMHMHDRTNAKPGTDDYKTAAIAKYTSDAWAVSDFLKLTKAIPPTD